MKKFPNLLLIAGTGNKSGKTTLACRIIEQFRDFGIVGIKITPHFHETTPGLNPLIIREVFSIYEETDPDSQKDTSRMLRSGASHVYFAKVTYGDLKEAFIEIMKQIPEGTPVVCESPSLRGYVEPGLFIIMRSSETYNNKDISNLLELPYIIINFEELQNTHPLQVRFQDRTWSYQ